MNIPMHRLLLISALALLAPLFIAAAERPASLDSRIDDLDAAIQKETADQDKKSSDSERRMRDYESRGMGASLIAQMRSAAERGDTRQIEEQLNQASSYFRSEGVKNAASALRAQIQADRAAREKAFADQIAATLDFAGKSVKAAKTPADLDEAIAKLAALNDRSNYQLREQMQAEMSRVSSVRYFVISWQDYLAAEAAGDKDRARSSLQSAAGNEEAGILPRSEILAKMDKLSDKTADRPTLEAVVGPGEITLQQLPSVLKSLGEALSLPYPVGFKDSDRNTAASLQSELSELQAACEQYNAGLPARFNIRGSRYGNSDTTARIAKYTLPPKTEFLRRVLPEYLGVTEKPGADETVQAYLDRLLAKASKELDTETMVKILDLQSAMQNSSAPRSSALQLLVVARNQEDAGQYTLAVLSYQTVLKAGDSLIPAKAVGARLDAIKAAHPEDYRIGTEKALAGAVASTGSFYQFTGDGYIVIPGSTDARARE